jgi:hypothetical protein
MVAIEGFSVIPTANPGPKPRGVAIDVLGRQSYFEAVHGTDQYERVAGSVRDLRVCTGLAERTRGVLRADIFVGLSPSCPIPK